MSPTKKRRSHRRSTFITTRDNEEMLQWEEECAEDATEAVTNTSLASFLDAEGRVTDWPCLRKLIFFKGIHPRSRPR